MTEDEFDPLPADMMRARRAPLTDDLLAALRPVLDRVQETVIGQRVRSRDGERTGTVEVARFGASPQGEVLVDWDDGLIPTWHDVRDIRWEDVTR